MKTRLAFIATLLALLAPVTANALCVCIECAWKPKRHFVIQSGDMKPTLEPGDCVIVDLIQTTPPKAARGDIVTFQLPLNGVFYIKRLIGLPGDTVQMKDGILWLNGAEASQRPLAEHIETYERDSTSGAYPVCSNRAKPGDICKKSIFEETLPGGTAYQILDIRPSGQDNTGVYTIPPGHVFVMGDNRDNSLDSRLPRRGGGMGFVSQKNIIGVLSP